MAVDATGTPTSLGIPKLNTAVDAPSGKGVNAMMDAIDVLIAALPSKPSGLVSGETIVYNGVAFDRSTVTKLGNTSLAGYPWVNADIAAGAAIVASKISGYPADATKFLAGDGTWISAGGGLQADRRNGTKDVVNTVAETDLFNGEIDIPANSMGNNGVVFLQAEGDYLNNSGASPTITFRFKIGATTLWAAVTAALASSAARGYFTLQVTIHNAGVTNVQVMTGAVTGVSVNGAAASTGSGGIGTTGPVSAVLGGTSAEDTTSTKNVAFTAQWSAANANNSVRIHRTLLSVVKGA